MISSEHIYKCIDCNIAGEHFILHPLKAIYWKEKKTLIISDLHLGKGKHFVKAGVPIPSKSIWSDNESRLNKLLQFFAPDRIVLLGDLFHSEYNLYWDHFCAFTQGNNSAQFILVKGNHDFLEKENYLRAGLEVMDSLEMDPFIFSHETLEGENGAYNLSGHVHPGVYLKGPALQGGRFPCFYFGKKMGLLPAFGAFTGLAMIKPMKEDQVFIITEEEVWEMPVHV